MGPLKMQLQSKYGGDQLQLVYIGGKKIVIIKKE